MKKMKAFLATFLLAGLLFAQKYPSQIYLVGSGYAERQSTAENITLAKERAMADLANQIQASVKSEFIDEVTETANSLSEYAHSKVKVISELQIDGVRWEVNELDDMVEANAILNKDEACELYFEKTRQLQDKLKGSMNRINQLMQSGDNERALRELFEASGLFNEIEQNVLIYMILGGREQTNLKPPFSRADLDDRIFTLTEKDFKNFSDVINGLCFQISKQIEPGQIITVYPFDYQDTSFGSELSDYIRQQILFNLSKFIKFEEGKVGNAEKKNEGVTVSGNYWIRNDKMELLITLYDEKGKTFGSARSVFPMQYVEATGIAYKPQNFVDAMSEDKLFSKNEVVYGNLNVEFWTNKGDRNLIFREGEEMHLYVRVNAPANIRFIYHLANGMRTPLYKSYYINESKVNRTVELPDVFECAPPFGVEKLQIFASSESLPPLNTKMVNIEGEQYEVLAEDIKEFLANTRGMIKKKTKVAQSAERVLTITTVEQ